MSADVTFVTGFPTTFLAVRVVTAVLADPAARVVCVVQPKSLDRAQAVLDQLGANLARRVEILEGDVAGLDMGLSGEEYNALSQRIHTIHHCASVTYLGVDRKIAEAANVGGAEEVVELADASAHLSRVVVWSTALVSGGRRGYVLEDELTAPDGFRNVIEETRFRAEKIFRRAADRLPITVLRPSILVGDSMTGEIDRFEGPYVLVRLLVNAPPDLRIPLPGNGNVPLNMVPIDYAVAAGLAIAGDKRSAGKTYHIVDPDPLSARRVFELIAQAAGMPMPRGLFPTTLAATLLKTPGLGRLSQVPRAFLEQLGTEVVYDDRNAREILRSTTLTCPAFPEYVQVLVNRVRDEKRSRQRTG